MKMNLLGLLLNAMTSSSSVNNISGKTGLSSKQIKLLLRIALPLLIKYLTKNASTQSGASSLLSALMQHRSTARISDQLKDADTDDGSRIVRHIFGEETNDVVKGIADESGIDAKKVGLALAAIAPALLSGLSAATTSASAQVQAKPSVNLADGLDLGDLIGMFGGAPAVQEKPQQAAGGIDGSALLGALTALMK